MGQPGYDNRADFTGDEVVDSPDFTLLKRNFGTAGGAGEAGPAQAARSCCVGSHRVARPLA